MATKPEKKITIRLPHETYVAYRKMCIDRDVRVTAHLRNFIEKEIDKYNKKLADNV